MLDLCLNKLVESEYIKVIGEDMYYKYKSEINPLENKMKELVGKCIPENGIKRKSLINFINSSIHSLIQDKDERLKIIEEYIDKCIKSKYLVVMKNGKINFN